MATLKDLKIRINSVKSTRKITSAMKMVAAAKLRRAQEQAEASRPYAARMNRMIASLAGAATQAGGPKLLSGTGRDNIHLLVVFTADRGLCGGFNSTVIRAARQRVRALRGEGKTVKLFCVGRRGKDALKREFGDIIVGSVQDVTRKGVAFASADELAAQILKMFEDEEFDICSLLFNRFQSAMTQIITNQQVIPASVPEVEEDSSASESGALYEYEPDEEAILAALLPRNVATQIFTALLESNASEHGARMTAMDNATRNAGDMIDKLTLNYNRARQANITKELIEIISGAEAV
ncbi:F0F1 ATP synthase subunit gamma [uncultured Nisaea sp.]|jgi:F-type H+-transporting ATPase subunit gamma|uniref:F0F1 ATP synthase subunit gamma n=1 Tax=uncultured Nisaea sp. TaxID=538215 RepID=UPI0030ECC7C1|tara:strand:+ start:2456 stop:3340 length:885 start_codon:yes stop_codon:yes gene_type:complete